MAAVIGGEIRDPVYAHEISGIGASRRQVNILDQDRAGRCAVACPQLLAVSVVVGTEKQRTVDVGQSVGIRVIAAGIDVLDHHGAGVGAVALP